MLDVFLAAVGLRGRCAICNIFFLACVSLEMVETSRERVSLHLSLLEKLLSSCRHTCLILMLFSVRRATIFICRPWLCNSELGSRLLAKYLSKGTSHTGWLV
ncbi:hypothetical protein BDZ89DRAFT_616663 [Hymenopellis radicata]|nr:hypothetical protein BDZ89DRAFT_616663 [Hymenopellis radicata]